MSKRQNVHPHYDEQPLRRAAFMRTLRREAIVVVSVLFSASAVTVAIGALVEPDGTRWFGGTAAEWQAKLRSTVPDSRDSAIAALSLLEPFSLRTINAAATMLADSSEDVATDAMEALLTVRDSAPRLIPRVLERARQTLTGPNVSGRVHAARLFGVFGVRAVSLAPALVQAMNDTSASVRAAAATALGNILEGSVPPSGSGGTEDVISGLRTALRDSAPPVRDAALEALSRIIPEDPRLLAVLKAALMDSSSDVRERASEMLALFDRRQERTPDGRAPAGTTRSTSTSRH